MAFLRLPQTAAEEQASRVREAEDEILRRVKVLGLSTGMGFPIRAVTIFERDQADLPFAGRDS